MHSLDAIFKPRSIAVVGASRNRAKLGNIILHNIVMGEFVGRVFPVHREAEVVHSIPAYPDLLAIPYEVDLVVIVVPARYVMEVVEQCIEKKVRGIVVITAGFKEIGGRGEEVEAEILWKVREAGIRLVGPNCMGVINTSNDVSMYATFARSSPVKGKVAFISQSGALGGAVIEYSHRSNVGISKFISLGNKADVSSNDMLEYLEDDEETDLVLMYVESVGNPRKFVQVARRITRKKPVIVVKSGRTAVGARAVSSHTGALAGFDVVYDALFEQCGVIRANSIEEMFDMAKVLTEQPRPTNNEVVVLTNGGGPGILAADALVSKGLKLPEVSEKTKEEFSEFFVKEASLVNPVDMTGNATPEEFGRALEVICRNERAYSIVGIFMPVARTSFRRVSEEIVRVKRMFPERLIMTCTVFEEKEEDIGILHNAEVPVFTYPEEVASALYALHKYIDYQKRPLGSVKEFDVDSERVADVFERVRSDSRRLLMVNEALDVVSSYGIPVVPYRLIRKEEELKWAAEEIGYPLVMKLVSKDVTHKTELGGVVLDIRNEDELCSQYRDLLKRAEGHEVEGVVVQSMVRGGKETIIGVVDDPTFGPLMMFGLGGIYVEVLKDVAFRPHPLTDIDAEEMITSIRSYPLLEGVRGEPPVNIPAVKEAILRLSQLVSDFHEIVEMDINPFIVGVDAASTFAVDARIMLRS